MAGDWIRLHRKLLESRVFSDFDLLGVWVWCLLRANWKDGWFHRELIKAGSFVTGQESGSTECRLSPSAWYRRMATLEQLGMISKKSNNRFTIVSICQWETYQNVNFENGEQANNKRITSGEQAETIEEGKEREEGKEEPPKPPRGHARKKPVIEVEIPEALQCECFSAAWGEWLTHRKENGWKIGPTGLRRTLTTLAAMGSTRATAAILYSIGKGWRGIFEEKNTGDSTIELEPEPNFR